ncbi:YfeC-like transcriptional regulator [Escherichia coli]
MFKERMTPYELARLTGYSRQTINKWYAKERPDDVTKTRRPVWQAHWFSVNEQVREIDAEPSRRSGK